MADSLPPLTYKSAPSEPTSLQDSYLNYFPSLAKYSHLLKGIYRIVFIPIFTPYLVVSFLFTQFQIQLVQVYNFLFSSSSQRLRELLVSSSDTHSQRTLNPHPHVYLWTRHIYRSSPIGQSFFIHNNYSLFRIRVDAVLIHY